MTTRDLPGRDELRDQLVRLVDARLLDPLEILLDDTAVRVARRAAHRGADDWAGTLLGADPAAATMTAARLVAALYPGDTAFDPPLDWWATPLGRVVAHRVGHPGATAVSYAVAGAMLGVTRQGVHDLVTRHKLDRHPDGGVRTDSVRDRLHQLSGRTT
ncbi:hypothetical protein [Actinocatenispora rupis]|uniref:MftR C-terminal domain-containing protein n=1 Tax=Actinocatenispora rupis TaxID=519421 RepID=A0A8J3J1R2_9ACTN|nr:hypothetical protein [Actinocatenispora rupis]GID12945.1 hypothetical protein Aru02nite_38340 [Actinocatenispora rupis]